MEVASVSVGDGVSDKPVKVYGITRVLDNALADSAEAEDRGSIEQHETQYEINADQLSLVRQSLKIL